MTRTVPQSATPAAAFATEIFFKASIIGFNRITSGQNRLTPGSPGALLPAFYGLDGKIFEVAHWTDAGSGKLRF